MADVLQQLHASLIHSLVEVNRTRCHVKGAVKTIMHAVAGCYNLALLPRILRQGPASPCKDSLQHGTLNVALAGLNYTLHRELPP
jgi:hypothetical protein